MRRGARILIAVAIVALLTAGALSVAYRKVMVVKNIEITGVDAETAQQVRYMSGIRLGQSIFDVDSRQIAINLRKDGYIKLCGVEVRKPDTVEIAVALRTPAAALEHLGFSYLVDGELCVLESSNGQTDYGVPLIKGADMQQTPVGMTLNMDSSRRELAIELIDAVYQAGLGELIAEINMADTQNLTLRARSGQLYSLGDRTNLASKLSLMSPVDARLSAEGRALGTVDVSSGRYADYIPPESTPAPTAMPGATAGPTQGPAFVPYATPQPDSGGN